MQRAILPAVHTSRKFKKVAMGNDIKLPVSQRSSLLESQRASDAEAKAQLNYEIEKISNQVDLINNQVNKIECGLKQTSRNIAYYKTLISDMSKTLHEIQIEQVNASLAHENHVEKAKGYLESLKEFQEKSETDSILDPDEEIANLEATVAMLHNTIVENEEFIVNGVTNNIP